MKPTYEELEAQIKQLETDNEKAMSVLKEANNAVLLAKSKFDAMAAENAGLNKFIAESCFVQAGEVPSWHQAIDHAPETPATDAFLAEVRAQGVDVAIEHLHKKFEGTGQIGVPVIALEWLAQELRKGAAQ